MTEAKVYIAEAIPQHATEVENVAFNLTEFEKIDPIADGFRCPMDSKYSDRSLPNAPEWVNLATFHEAMLALSHFFSCTESELKARLDYIWNCER